MNRRKSLTLFGGLAAGISSSRACLWDSNTLKDELASNPKVLDLILGQFPHHGDVFYQTRIARLEKQASLNVNENNDLAVAYVRLNEFKKGMAILEEQIKKTPGHYETLSNIGVTAKKSGDFKKGADFIAKALAIKPEGHMGLGDWYLKALRWRTKYERSFENRPPAFNFLNIPYLGVFRENYYGMEEGFPRGYPIQLEHRNRFLKMVRNDQTFADGFAALGDYLTFSGDLNLAFLAYTRAMVLKHQNPVEIRRRRRTYLKHAEAHIRDPKRKHRGTAFWKAEIAKAEGMIRQGLAWLERYKTVEGELVSRVGDERKVEIADVEAKLVERKISRVTIS